MEGDVQPTENSQEIPEQNTINQLPILEHKKSKKKLYIILGTISIIILLLFVVRAVSVKIAVDKSSASIKESIYNHIEIRKGSEYYEKTNISTLEEAKIIIQKNEKYLLEQINNLKKNRRITKIIRDVTLNCPDGKTATIKETHLGANCNGTAIFEGGENYVNISYGGSRAIRDLIGGSMLAVDDREKLFLLEINEYDLGYELFELATKMNLENSSEKETKNKIIEIKKNAPNILASVLNYISSMVEISLMTPGALGITELLNLSEEDQTYNPELTNEGLLKIGTQEIKSSEITTLDDEMHFFRLLKEFESTLGVPSEKEIINLDFKPFCKKSFKEVQKDLPILKKDILSFVASTTKICESFDVHKKASIITKIKSLESEKNPIIKFITKMKINKYVECSHEILYNEKNCTKGYYEKTFGELESFIRENRLNK